MTTSKMFRGLIEATIWTNEDRLDASIGDYDDFAPSAIAYLEDYCRQFAAAFEEFCIEHEYIGHDLWLTTCGHGAGFWDGDWEEPIATQLSEWCRKHGDIELYVGDDQLIYICGKESFCGKESYSND